MYVIYVFVTLSESSQDVFLHTCTLLNAMLFLFNICQILIVVEHLLFKRFRHLIKLNSFQYVRYITVKLSIHNCYLELALCLSWS